MLTRDSTTRTIARFLEGGENVGEDYYNSTLSRDDLKRYIVRLPFKDPKNPKLQLRKSYAAALRTLQHMESAFKKDEKLKLAYI